jgi:polysaccharide biosynthesis PFTS motif protein
MNYNNIIIDLLRKFDLPEFLSSRLRVFLIKKLIYLDLIKLKNYKQDEFNAAVENVKIKYRFNLKTLGKILTFYLAFIFLFFRSSKQYSRVNLNLVYGLDSKQIFQNSSTDSLYNFLRKLFSYKSQNPHYVIETNAIKLLSKRRGSFLLSRNIDIFLYTSFLTSKQKMRLIILMGMRIFYFLYYSRKYGSMILIWQQFIFQEPLYEIIEKQLSKKVLSLLTTQSAYRNLPFIFEYFQNSIDSFMIWYSANSVPINYKNQQSIRVQFTTEVYKVLPIQNHLVWTTDHAKYLQSIVPKEINVSVNGSLMFYVQENNFANKIFDVSVFDVSPYASSRLDEYQKIPIDLNSIYSEDHVVQFINDIINTVNLLSVNSKRHLTIAIKYKRGLNDLHSQKYRNLLRELELMENITILNSEANLYDLIHQSRSVIGFPFVSPSVIARELNVPVIYYSSNKIMASYKKFHGVQVVQSLKGLRLFLEESLNLK